MAESRRQRLVDAVVTRMKAINGAGSYVTNLANRVEDGRLHWHVGDDEVASEIPAISVFDGEDEITPTSPGKALSTMHLLEIRIRGHVAQGTAGMINARRLLKDINTAIRSDEKWVVSNVQLAMQTHDRGERIIRDPDT